MRSLLQTRLARLSLAALSTLPVLAGAQALELMTPAAFPMAGAGGAGLFAPGVRVLSDDGRYLVFESDAPNLLAGQLDLNGEPDVFLHDRIADTLTLVSHAPGGPLTAGNGASAGATVSADAAYVVFESHATNLVAGSDVNLGGSDVFLFERSSGTVTLVSHLPALPGTTGAAASATPVISADGAYVAFTSDATDLVAGSDTNVGPDVFLYQRASGTLTLVSHAAGAPGTASNGASQPPRMSGDGRYLAFAGDGTNLVAGASDTNNREDVFLYDRIGGALTLVSHASSGAGTAANDSSLQPTLSADGAWVAFESDATNLVAGGSDGNGKSDVFLYDRAGGGVTLASHTAGSPTTAGNERSRVALVSADGNWVAFESRASNLVAGSDTNLLEDVFLFSRVGGAVTLASHLPGLPTSAGDDASFVNAVSASASHVAFHGLATNLAAGGDANLAEDVFLFARASGNVSVVSHALGAPTVASNGLSNAAALSADASAAALVSAGSNLVAFAGGVGREVYAYQAASGLNALVSRAIGSSVTASGLTLIEPGHRRTVSDDGRFVVFTSDAPNLVAGQVDGNGEPDVFLYDAALDQVTLVSHVPGAPAAAGNADSARPSMSVDGAYVTFATNATNLSATPVLECQVYLYARATDTLALVSHAAGAPDQGGNDCSDGPALSADGAWLAFYSLASDLVAGSDTNDANDAFLYERATGLVRLVSHTPGNPTTAGNDGAALVFGRGYDTPAISADGSYVAFTSLASNLVAGSDTNGDPDVFLFARGSGAVTLVSHPPGLPGNAGGAASESPLISRDGEYVAFSSLATNLVGGSDTNGVADVFLFARTPGTVTLVSHAVGAATTAANGASLEHALSADGNSVALASDATNLVVGTDGNTATDVFLYSRAAGTLSLVSHAAGAPTTAAGGTSGSPRVSADADWVAFASSAANLLAGTDTNGLADVFLVERSGGTVWLVSHVPASTSTTGNSLSESPVISGAGNHVAFATFATDLVAGDAAGAVDAFHFSVPPVPVELQAFTLED